MKSLELEGTVKHILDPVQGEGSRGPWKRQEFVIETGGDYSRDVCFTVWNDKVDLSQLQEGLAVKVFFNLSSREGKTGKWFTSATVWRINAGGDAGGGSSNDGAFPDADIPDPEPPEAPSQETNDDLPF